MTISIRAPKGTKKISTSMMAGLKRLVESDADFYELSRAGCNGAGSAHLVKHGLAEKILESNGSSSWRITISGKSAFENGFYIPNSKEPLAKVV